MNTLPGIDEPTYRQLVQNALDMWTGCCGLTHRHEYTARLANILCTSRHIDGSGKVLGETELPCGVEQVRMWLDNGERWDTSGRFARNGISAQQVVDHEVAHALGLGHAPERGNIMYWQHDPDQREPGPWDIAEMVKRYGPRNAPPPEPPPAPKPNKPTGGDPVDKSKVYETILYVLKMAKLAAVMTSTTADDKILDGLIELVELLSGDKVSHDQLRAFLDDAKANA